MSDLNEYCCPTCRVAPAVLRHLSNAPPTVDGLLNFWPDGQWRLECRGCGGSFAGDENFPPPVILAAQGVERG